MTIKLNLSNSELWHMLQAQGYKVIISERDDTKFVQIKGKYSKSPYNAGQYSTDFTEREIIMDCLPKILTWSGLKPRIVLDY